MKKALWLVSLFSLLALLAGIQACNSNTNPAFATHPCPNTSFFGIATGVAGGAATTCSIYASPYTLAQNADIYQFEAYGMAGTFTVGLYTDYSGVPGNLIFTTGSINGAGVSQNTVITISPIGLSPATYWLALENQGPVTLSIGVGTGVNTYSPVTCSTGSLPASISGIPTPTPLLGLTVKADYCF